MSWTVSASADHILAADTQQARIALDERSIVLLGAVGSHKEGTLPIGEAEVGRRAHERLRPRNRDRLLSLEIDRDRLFSLTELGARFISQQHRAVGLESAPRRGSRSFGFRVERRHPNLSQRTAAMVLSSRILPEPRLGRVVRRAVVEAELVALRGHVDHLDETTIRLPLGESSHMGRARRRD